MLAFPLNFQARELIIFLAHLTVRMSISHVTLPPPGYVVAGTCGNYLLKSALEIKYINSLLFLQWLILQKILSPQNRPISPTQGHGRAKRERFAYRTWAEHVLHKIIY